jgi:hypothetical protein
VFTQYSGYVTVNEQAGRALLYWLIESPASRGADSKPLVVLVALLLLMEQLKRLDILGLTGRPYT